MDKETEECKEEKSAVKILEIHLKNKKQNVEADKE